MYSFHLSEADLNDYYERVTSAYMAVYRRCGIGETTYLTFASGGAFSKYSHEFQTVTEFGEDTIHVCERCRVAVNKEIVEVQSSCPTCGNESLTVSKAIEVGNIFKLQTRFSEPFGFGIPDASGKRLPIVMGCYGIGSSRLMGAIVEMSHDENGIIWPDAVAPFAVHLVSLAKSDAERRKADELYEEMTRRGMEVLYDDRTEARPGEKFADADIIGIPTRMVVSEKTLAAGSVEVKKRTEKNATLVRWEDALSL
jgi:prolyl-tRNA synthetase